MTLSHPADLVPVFRHFTSREEIDAAYDVERSIDDFAGIIERCISLSAEARRTLPHQLDLSYGPTLDEVVDVFPAQGNDWSKPPLFIFSTAGTGISSRGVS